MIHARRAVGPFRRRIRTQGAAKFISSQEQLRQYRLDKMLDRTY